MEEEFISSVSGSRLLVTKRHLWRRLFSFSSAGGVTACGVPACELK